MRISLLFLLLLLPLASDAKLQGRARLDSLVQALPHITVDTDRMEAYYQIASDNHTINPSEGLKYGQMFLELATSLKSRVNIIRAYTVLGTNYQFKSDYARAISYFNQALVLCPETEFPGLYSDLISHLAVIYQELGETDKALGYHFKSLHQNTRLNNKVSMGGDLGNIGIAYMLKKDYEKALEYDFKSLEIFKEINDTSGVAHNYGNIGNVYQEYGNYVLALEYDMKSLALFTQIGDNGGMAINNGNIGEVYLEVVRTMSGEAYTSLPESNQQPKKVLPKGTKEMFLAKAISYLEQSITISKQIEQLDNIVEFSMNLSDAYALAGNYQKALENYKLYVAFKDSIYSDETRLKYARLETEREQLLKEKQIEINHLAKENQRKQRILYVFSLTILIGVTAVITRKFYAQKKRNRLLALERKKHLERIEKQKEVMGDIAYTHSHDVSGQVATIMGLVDVFNATDYADPDNKVVIDGIGETAKKLDIIVKDMIVKENTLNSRKG